MNSARVAASIAIARVSKASSRPSFRPERGEEVDQRPGAGERPLDALRPDDRRRRGHHRVRRVAGVARRVGGDQDRVADQVDLGRHRDVEQRAVVRRRRSRAPAAARSWPAAAAARGRAPSGRAPRSPASSGPSPRRPTCPSCSAARSPRRPARPSVGDLRGIGLGRRRPAAARARPAARCPGRWPIQGFSARLPRGAKSGSAPFSAITAVSAAGMCGDVGDDRALASRRPGSRA